MNWQPIETAPKDGTVIMLYRPTALAWARVSMGKWERQEFSKNPSPYWDVWHKVIGVTESRSWAPTHWMPLPEPPK